jgi:hypothetical protein
MRRTTATNLISENYSNIKLSKSRSEQCSSQQSTKAPASTAASKIGNGIEKDTASQNTQNKRHLIFKSRSTAATTANNNAASNSSTSLTKKPTRSPNSTLASSASVSTNGSNAKRFKLNNSNSSSESSGESGACSNGTTPTNSPSFKPIKTAMPPPSPLPPPKPATCGKIFRIKANQKNDGNGVGVDSDESDSDEDLFRSRMLRLKSASSLNSSSASNLDEPKDKTSKEVDAIATRTITKATTTKITASTISKSTSTAVTLNGNITSTFHASSETSIKDLITKPKSPINYPTQKQEALLNKDNVGVSLDDAIYMDMSDEEGIEKTKVNKAQLNKVESKQKKLLVKHTSDQFSAKPRFLLSNVDDDNEDDERAKYRLKLKKTNSINNSKESKEVTISENSAFTSVASSGVTLKRKIFSSSRRQVDELNSIKSSSALICFSTENETEANNQPAVSPSSPRSVISSLASSPNSVPTMHSQTTLYAQIHSKSENLDLNAAFIHSDSMNTFDEVHVIMRKPYECEELGETQAFLDDLYYLMDGLSRKHKLSERCLCAIKLAEQCGTSSEFRMNLRSSTLTLPSSSNQATIDNTSNETILTKIFKLLADSIDDRVGFTLFPYYT